MAARHLLRIMLTLDYLYTCFHDNIFFFSMQKTLQLYLIESNMIYTNKVLWMRSGLVESPYNKHNDTIQLPVWLAIEFRIKQELFRRRKMKLNSLNSALLFLMNRVHGTLHSVFKRNSHSMDLNKPRTEHTIKTT